MRKALVIQTARLGDFLQTTALLGALREAYSGCEIHVLTDAALRDAVALCGYVDVHHMIDTAAMSSAATTGDVAAFYACLYGQCEMLQDAEFDAVYNLNYGMLGALLAAVPRAHRRYGYVLSASRREIIPDPWFAFLIAAVRHRPLAPFHLSDLFCNCGAIPAGHPRKLSCSVPRSSHERAAELLDGIGTYRRRIALQLSARHHKRQWPAASFAETANRLLDDQDTAIVLTGASADADVGREFIAHTASWPPEKRGRVRSLIGATTIAELAAVLQRCSVLVTADTETLHLAAAVGTATVSLFLGPANPGLTGPYGTGHLVLTPRVPCAPCCEDARDACAHCCAQSITPEHVRHAVVYVLDGTPLPGGVFDRAGVLVSRNDGYGIFFAPLASDEKRPLRDLCYRVMGYAALGQSAAQDFDTGSFSEDLFAGMSGSGCRDTLLRQIEILARAAVAHPFAPVAHRLQDDFSFWHPWLDFYHLLLRHRDECTSVLDPAVFFTTGLGAAARMLAGGPHTVVQGTQYDH